MFGALEIGSLSGEVVLVDNASDVLDNIANAGERTTQSFRQLGFGIVEVGRAMESAGRLMSATVTAPLVAAGAAAIHFGSEFEAEMTKVITLAGATQDEVSGITQAVLDLSRKTGNAPAELAKGLVQVESAGLKGKAALDALETSANMTALGMGTVEDNTLALVGAMLAYKDSNLTAAQAGDILLKTIQLGNDKVENLVPALARVTPIAAAFGVSFADINASIATFTHLGASTDVAATGIRAVLAMILNDSAKTEKGLHALGISMEDLRKEIQEKGLTEALIHLVSVAKEAPGGLDKLHEVFGNIRAFTDVLATAGASADQYQSITDEVRKASGTITDAVKVNNETFAQQWKQFRAELDITAISLSKTLLPIGKDIIKFFKEDLIPIVQEAIDVFKTLPEPIQKVGLAFATAAALAGPFLLFGGAIVTTIGHIMRALAFLLPETVSLGSLGSTLAGMIPSFEGIGAVFTGLTAAIAGSTVAVGALTAGLAGLAAGVAIALAVRHYEEALDKIQKDYQKVINEMTPEGQKLNDIDRIIDTKQRDTAKKLLEFQQKNQDLLNTPLTAGTQATLKITPVGAMTKEQLGAMGATMASQMAPLESGISLSLFPSKDELARAEAAKQASIRSNELLRLNTELYGHTVDKLADDIKKYALAAFAQNKTAEQVVSTLKEAKGLKFDEADTAAIQRLHKLYEEGTEKQKKYAEGWMNLNSVGETAFDTVAKINPGLVDQARYYLQIGASVGDLEKAYPELTRNQIEAISVVDKLQDTYDGLSLEQMHLIMDAVEHEKNIALVAKAYKMSTQAAEDFGKAVKHVRDIEREASIGGMTGPIGGAAGLIAAQASQEQELLNKSFQQEKDYRNKILELGEYGVAGRMAQIQRAEDAEIESLHRQGIATKNNLALVASYYDKLRKSIFIDWQAIHDNSNQSLQEVADRAWRTYQFMADRSGEFSEVTRRHFQDIAATAADTARGFQDSWGIALNNLSSMFSKLGQVAGGHLGSVLSNIGQVVVMLEEAHKAEETQRKRTIDLTPETYYDDATGQMVTRPRNPTGTPGKFGVLAPLFAGDKSTGIEKLSAGITAAAAIAQGAISIWNATGQSRNVAANSLGGAMAGAQAGAAFGPWGIAIGAAAGLVTGLIRGEPKWARAADDVARDFGTKISDDLAKAIADTADTEFRGDRFTATIAHLGDIIKEAGGLTDKNLSMFTGRLHDVFSMIQIGHMTVEQGAKVLDQTFADFAKAGTDRLGFLSKQLKEIIALDATMKTNSVAVKDYKVGQLASAGTNIGTALGVGATAYDKLAEDEKKLADLKKDLSQDEITNIAKIADLREKMAKKGADPLDIAKWQVQIDQLTEKLSDAGAEIEAVSKDIDIQKGIIAAAAVTTQAGATGVAGAIVGIVANATALGKGFVDAVKDVEPAISALGKQLDKAGLDGGAAFQFLRDMVSLVTDDVAGPALTAAENWGNALVNLNNIGALNQDMFEGLATQISQTYTSLVAGGKDSKLVMIGMQQPLQQLWQLQHDYGFQVDDSTQKLLDEAQAQGIVGEVHKSATDRMVDSLEHLGKDLDALLVYFGVSLPDAVKKGTDDASKSVGNLGTDIDKLPRYKDFDFNIKVNGTMPTPPEPDPNRNGPIPAASGFHGMVSGPTRFLAGEGKEPEYVSITPMSQMGDRGPATVSIGGMHFYFPEGTKTDNKEDLASNMRDIIRDDTLFVRTGLVKLVDSRLKSLVS